MFLSFLFCLLTVVSPEIEKKSDLVMTYHFRRERHTSPKLGIVPKYPELHAGPNRQGISQLGPVDFLYPCAVTLNC